MNQNDISKLVLQGENERLGFKSGAESSEIIAREVCGMLNHDGGRLILGVSDSARIVGVEDPGSVISHIEKDLPLLISPRALWSAVRVDMGHSEVVVLEVPKGMNKPYVTGGVVFLRYGNHVVKATADDLGILIREQAAAGQRWERRLAIGADREALDDELIRETVSSAVRSQRWQKSADDLDGFLQAMGLLSQGEVTNAALVLYGKTPARFLPQIRVRILVMPEGKTGNRIAGDRWFEKGLIENIRDLESALKSVSEGRESLFTNEKWQRSERTTYPMSALREGVMNALVHRDYESNGMTIIEIRHGSLTISNPGELPVGLKPGDLKRVHPSIPRNPDLAHVCYLHRLIEMIGRGTQRIVEDCRNANFKEPKWTSSKLETRLTFSMLKYEGEKDLNDRQNLIIEVLKVNKKLNISDIIDITSIKVSERTIRNDLVFLIERGLVGRQGRGPATVYSLR